MIDTPDEALISDEKIERLRAIFNIEKSIETDADLLELAKYVEDESDEARELVIDHDFDFGHGN